MYLIRCVEGNEYVLKANNSCGKRRIFYLFWLKKNIFIFWVRVVNSHRLFLVKKLILNGVMKAFWYTKYFFFYILVFNVIWMALFWAHLPRSLIQNISKRHFFLRLFPPYLKAFLSCYKIIKKYKITFFQKITFLIKLWKL